MEVLIDWIKENSQNKKHEKVWENTVIEHKAIVHEENGAKDKILTAKSKAGIKRGTRMPLPPNCILTLDKVVQSDIGVIFPETEFDKCVHVYFHTYLHEVAVSKYMANTGHLVRLDNYYFA
uniref:Uncharacterized protein n=1 Tax=Aplanochytrium stocchinoi TaxID=215587 RepID=A0A7S3UZS1_9STRA